MSVSKQLGKKYETSWYFSIHVISALKRRFQMKDTKNCNSMILLEYKLIC